ncbi:MAG: hypothetical protein AAFX07_11760, partial [Pseudomonadota bacterium]
MFRTITYFLVAAATLLLPNASEAEAEPLPDYVVAKFGQPPTIPDEPLSLAMQFAVRVAFVDSVMLSTWDRNQTLALEKIAESEDPRLAWLISDFMRFVPSKDINLALTNAASSLLGKQFTSENSWGAVTDHLIAWNIPAPPDYLSYKRAIYTSIVP